MSCLFRHGTLWILAIALWYSGAAIAGVASVRANSSISEGVNAKGTLAYSSRGGALSATLRYAWLVKGADSVDPRKTVRRDFDAGLLKEFMSER